MAFRSSNSLTKLAFGLLAGTTLSVLLLPEATLAQTLQNDPGQDFQKQGDAINGGTGQSFSVFDLIHRSNLGGNRSMEDVNNEQKENLDSAAAEFRAKQRQRLQIPARLTDGLAPTNQTNSVNNSTSGN